MSTATRQKNIETIINFSRYLEAHGSKSFLPDITDKVDLPSVAPDFDLDILKFEISLDGQGYELKDVFNNVVPNEQTPYIFLIQGGNFFAKIYEQSEFPKEWLHPSTKTEGIFFRLQTSKEKDFNEIIWSREFVITFNFKLSNITSLDKIPNLVNENKTYLTTLIKNTKLEIQLKNSQYKLVSLGGRFVVPDFKLEPKIFSAYVTNDSVAQKYLFFDEYQKTDGFNITKTINTIHTKKYISVFFDLLEPGKLVSSTQQSRRTYSAIDANPLTAVKLTITSDGPNTNVRILNVSSLKNITTVSKYFVGLINTLKYKRNGIINRYKKVGLDLPVARIQSPEKFPKKIRRLDELKKIDPMLFGSGYSRKCQSPLNQPIGIVGNDNVDRYLTEHKQYFGTKKGDFKVKYSYGATTADDVRGDTWYVCVPPQDPSNPKIFPYLLEAKHDATGKGLLDLDPNRPFVPCCSIENTKLKKWGEGKEGKEEKKKEGSVAITQPDKTLRENIKGYIPLALKEAWNDTDDIYLRLGVKKDPNSFIRCLSLALKDNLVNIQTKLADGIKTCRTQETFGYSTDQLEVSIRDNKFIDPTLFLGVAQTTLNIQIFLYVVSKKYPKGDIARPRTAFAYLTPLETYTHSVVIVIQQNIQPPQCELIIRKDTNQTVFNQDDPLVGICNTIQSRSSQVVKVAEDESPGSLRSPPPGGEPEILVDNYDDPVKCPS